MGTHRSWLALVGFCFTMALGVALACAIVLAGSTLAFAGAQDNPSTGADNPAPTKTFSGMITDSLCGARHTQHPKMNSAQCTRECVRRGGKYVLIDGDNQYTLQGDVAKMTQFAGERAEVTGALVDSNTIRVTSISAPDAAGKK